MTHLLLEKLKAAPSARIINVSAVAYQLAELDLDDLQFDAREYKPGDAYSQSKLAVMLFTRKLSKQLDGMSIFVRTLIIHKKTFEAADRYPIDLPMNLDVYEKKYDAVFYC